MSNIRIMWKCCALTLVLCLPLPTLAKNDNEVFLRFNNLEVTRLDIEAELQRIPPERRANFFTDAKRASIFLTGIFVQKRLAMQSRKAGLHLDSVVAKRMEYAQEKVLAEEFVEFSIENDQPPDFEELAREQYLAQKERYKVPERIRVSHILIGVNGEDRDDDALALAESVLEKARGGQSFSELALEFSSDRSVKTNKGNLGLLSRGKMVKPFEDVAFALKQSGDISDIVKTQFGFHIIKLEAREAAFIPLFDEVKINIVKDLRSSYEKRLRDQIFADARSMDGVELNEEAIGKFRESFGLMNKD